METTIEKRGIRQSYSVGPYDKNDGVEQWIRVSQGCPNRCPYCYEPPKLEWFGIPPIVCRDVHIMDMNFLAHPQAIDAIDDLALRKVDGLVVEYTLECGIDYRFLTDEIARKLRQARFYDMRLAWDWWYSDQYKIKDAVVKLKRAGFKNFDITIFMICNWEIPFKVCMDKLNLCKYWAVKVADCYFDGQISPNVEPIGWTKDEIVNFRREVRHHNQLAIFGIEPERPLGVKGHQRTIKSEGEP